MQMAHALATGSKFLGEYPTDGRQRVVFLQAELSEGWFQKRIRKLNDRYGPADELFILNGQMTFGKVGQYAKSEINLAPLEQIIVSHRADVVFIDPLQGYVDIPENNTDANREFQRQLSTLRHKYECAIVVTHHDRKTDAGEGLHRMRGSSVLSDWADVVLALQREFVTKKNEAGEKYKDIVPHVVQMTYDKVRHAEGERPATDRLRRCLGDGGYQTPWLEMHPNQTPESQQECG
jgi:RecA-family ATPase